MRDAALVEVLGRGDEAESWEVSDAGRAAVVAWMGRIEPLFAGWPPDVPGVDGVGGF